MPVEVKVLIWVVLTSLAGAAIFYITFLIAVDEVRSPSSLGWAVIIGIGIVCLKNKLK